MGGTLGWSQCGGERAEGLAAGDPLGPTADGGQLDAAAPVRSGSTVKYPPQHRGQVRSAAVAAARQQGASFGQGQGVVTGDIDGGHASVPLSGVLATTREVSSGARRAKRA